MKNEKQIDKKMPGRPRVHEVGKWTSVQFRLPLQLRTKLLDVLQDANSKLSYRLSLNSLLLHLVNKGLTLKSALIEEEKNAKENE